MSGGKGGRGTMLDLFVAVISIMCGAFLFVSGVIWLVRYTFFI